MKVLVTGGKGQLGFELKKISLIKNKLNWLFTDRQSFDIFDLANINVYLNGIGDYQNKAYDLILDLLKDGASKGNAEFPNFSNMESFGYAMLQNLLEALNIVYPDEQLDDQDDLKNYEKNKLIGKHGLKRMMTYQDVKSNPPVKGNFEYKSSVISKYGEIFSPENLPTYSAKMSNICSTVVNSEGIILIYSQYIDGGLVPMALALESIGFTKYGSSSLFKAAPTEPIDAITGKPKGEVGDGFSPAKYIMITGDKAYSPNNDQMVKAATNENNLNGEKIDYLPAAVEDQLKIKPIYKTFAGWKTSTNGIKNINDLPDNAKKYIFAIEDFVGAKISSISTSPERDDTILVENPFEI